MKFTPVAFIVVALTVCLASIFSHASAAERKPNVVFILADDLGYGEIGSFGQKLIRTPNLNRLAEQGMRLTQHYSGSPVCAPSRCVLMTGKHPGHAWVRNNRGMKPEGQQPIPASEITLAELMREQGYVTGSFGKWGLGGPGTEGDPIRQGFDRFFGYNCQSLAHSYYPSFLWSNGARVRLNNNPPVPGRANLPADANPNDPSSYDCFKGKDYAPDRINEQALEFIRANKDRPFFLYYPTILVHLALHVPDEELKPYLELGWNDPPFTKKKGGGYTPHFTPRAAYAAMITRMDRNIGNILRLLDKLDLAENTIVIFTSDNGTTHLKREVDYEFFNSVDNLRGLKGSLYEGGIRVPTIVRWPGHIAPGTSSDRISGFEDWMPTILEHIGASTAIPQGIDGISLAPTLLGRKQEPRRFLYREFTGYGGQQSIRVGDWKAIRANMNRGNLKLELYNLAEDPGERNNVADQHADIVEMLESQMRRQHVRSKLFPLQTIDNP